MLSREGSTPDEEDDPIPDEKDGDVVVRDDERDRSEDDRSDE